MLFIVLFLINQIGLGVDLTVHKNSNLKLYLFHVIIDKNTAASEVGCFEAQQIHVVQINFTFKLKPHKQTVKGVTK